MNINAVFWNVAAWLTKSLFFFLVRRDGSWSFWSPWTPCSATCGKGEQTRQRSCNSPPPQHGGGSCVGDDREAKKCKAGPCPSELEKGEIYWDARCLNNNIFRTEIVYIFEKILVVVSFNSQRYRLYVKPSSALWRSENTYAMLVSINP